MKLQALITALALTTSALAAPPRPIAGKRGEILGGLGLGGLLGGGTKPAPAPAPAQPYPADQPAPAQGGNYGGSDFSSGIQDLKTQIAINEAAQNAVNDARFATLEKKDKVLDAKNLELEKRISALENAWKDKYGYY